MVPASAYPVVDSSFTIRKRRSRNRSQQQAPANHSCKHLYCIDPVLQQAGWKQKALSIVAVVRMRHFTIEELQTWDRFTRAHFINSLSGFKSASLVATVNEEGIPNLAIFSNIVHLGADPALIGMVNRPREAAPHTLANIEATGAYTINLFTKEQMQAAHQTSAKYAAGVSEFDATGFTPEWHAASKAPFVKESPVKYALTLKEILPIHWNRTFFIIGEVQHVLAEESLLQPDGFLALEQQGIITSLGIDAYYTTQLQERLPYAKP